MSRFNGQHYKGYMKDVRAEKRAEAEARDLVGFKTYRKLPVRLGAMLYDGTNGAEVVKWVRAGGYRASLRGGDGGGSLGATIGIQTPEGVIWASPGDYVIRGVAGEFYPCKPDIFDATYEVVE